MSITMKHSWLSTLGVRCNSPEGQSRHFDRGPAPSGLPRSTDIIRPARYVGLVPMHKVAAIGIGGSLAAPPLPHHRTYGSVYGGSRGYANALRSNDSTRVGWAVRGHSPPRAIRCLPLPPAGLHPSAPMRSPGSTGCSAACRSRDSCPTCLSSRSGLQ